MENFKKFCQLSAKLLKAGRTKQEEAGLFELIEEIYKFEDGTRLLSKELKREMADAALSAGPSSKKAAEEADVYRQMVNGLYLAAKQILQKDEAVQQDWQNLLQAARYGAGAGKTEEQKKLCLHWSLYAVNYVEHAYNSTHPRKEAV